MSGTFYITTAISYVNAKPHIGHAYEFIASDAIARYQRMLRKDVFFLSGVDEHSVKVEKAAAAAGMEPAPYCDQISQVFRELHELSGSSLDGFIRTSEPRHHKTTQEMLNRSKVNGDIYQDVYEGWYSPSSEAFMLESDLLEGNLDPVSKTPCEWMREENYFFKLSAYTDKLKDYYAAHPEFVYPETYKNEMLSLIGQGLRDISISRSTTKWGIPVPWDPAHVAYVWFDALTNYLTGVGFMQNDEQFQKYWPADVHVIGKDITRFHAVFWPAMLLSTGVPLPKQILVHGFIFHKGEKMSKSIGNVVDPFSLIKEYGRDPLRYFLLREIAFGQDGNYSEESLIKRYNSDLANDLGNLFSRVLAMIKKYRGGVVPSPAGAEDSLRDLIHNTVNEYQKQMEVYALHRALSAVWDLIGFSNRYVDEQAPWALAKDETKADQLDRVLLNLAEALRVTAVLIYPFMPSTSAEMLNRLACPFDTIPTIEDAKADNMTAGKTVSQGDALFPRLEKS